MTEQSLRLIALAGQGRTETNGTGRSRESRNVDTIICRIHPRLFSDCLLDVSINDRSNPAVPEMQMCDTDFLCPPIFSCPLSSQRSRYSHKWITKPGNCREVYFPRRCQFLLQPRLSAGQKPQDLQLGVPGRRILEWNCLAMQS